MPFPVIAAMAINAALGAAGGKSAANAQENAAAQAGALANRAFDYTRTANQPYTNLGSQAANALGSVYGYAPADPTAMGYGNSPFLQSDYQWLASNWGKVRDSDVFGAGASGPWSWMNDPSQMAGLSPEAQAFVTSNWSAIRPAANFQDINWNASTGYAGGTPIGYQAPAAPAATPVSNYESFFASPDFQFRQQQGDKNINNWFAARGGAQSGNALKALTEYNSNLAAGEFGNWFNRQLGLTGVGQTANAQNAAAGTNNAALAGNAAMAAGDARASGILNTTNTLQNALYDTYDILNRRRGGGTKTRVP